MVDLCSKYGSTSALLTNLPCISEFDAGTAPVPLLAMGVGRYIQQYSWKWQLFGSVRDCLIPNFSAYSLQPRNPNLNACQRHQERAVLEAPSLGKGRRE